MTGYLPLIWAIIMAFAVIMYVILDGFDLGIGILFPWIPSKEHRDLMINSVAPLWDGNETWMVLGGATLYGAFPLAYSLLLPMLYMPIMIMLAALIFRGVAFEFRFKAHRSRFVWDIAFWAGSTMAAFCQGLILGTFIVGYTPPANLATEVLSPAWLTPFSLMTGVAVIIGYALLGATWLIMKTEGELQNNMYNAAKTLLVVITFFLAAVSIWTPFIHPAIMERWFSTPNFYYLLPLPIVTGFIVIYASYSLFKRYEKLPFALSIALFLLCYIGLCISSWPYLVPRSITFWQAASSPSSLKFLLVGAIILLPTLLAYSIYSYRVFRGKVSLEHGYH
jgi:cytochrome d ubiquinol oxidase subunit II